MPASPAIKPLNPRAPVHLFHQVAGASFVHGAGDHTSSNTCTFSWPQYRHLRPQPSSHCIRRPSAFWRWQAGQVRATARFFMAWDTFERYWLMEPGSEDL